MLDGLNYLIILGKFYGTENTPITIGSYLRREPEMTTTLEKNAESTVKQPQWGTRFKSAREAMHLTEKEVATRLHLKSHIIILIETESFADAPPAIFMRGYIRSYARLLNFTQKEIDQALNQLTLENPSIKASTTATLRPRTSAMPNNHNSNYTGVTTALIVLVLVALVGMWWTNHPRYTNSEIAKQSIVPPLATAPTVPAQQAVAAQAASIPIVTINPSDPVPKELVDSKPAPPSIEEPKAATSVPAVAQSALPNVTPETRQNGVTPSNAQQAETSILDDLPISGPTPLADPNATLTTPSETLQTPPAKKHHRIARNHRSESEQDLALPEAGLEGDAADLESNGNLY